MRRARPGRRSRSGRRQTRAARRGGRRAQHPVDRAAGHRQEHARAAPAGPVARAVGERSARCGVHRLGEHSRLQPARLRTPAVPRATSHRVGERDHRWRPARTARGSESRASRRAVPGRTARVQPARARKPARAARNRRGGHFPRGAAGGLSGALSADRRHESLSLRLSSEKLPGAAVARRRKSRAIAPASPGHCSIASTCASRFPRCPAKSC